MKSPALLALLVMLGAVSHPTHAQTPWPEFMATLVPGPSRSTVLSAPLGDAKVDPPAGDLAADKARWSGRWTGWACQRNACDTQLVVEKVTAQGATIVYAYASPNVAPFTARLEAAFVGDELQAEVPGGARITYRLRADGDVLEFMWRRNAQAWVAGVLSRRP